MEVFKRVKRKRKCTENNGEGYEALTPRDDMENGQEYINALDWALSQKNVHNIAVSGPYGSGKSSMIESYLRQRGRDNILRISLAAFNLDEMKTAEDNKKIDMEKLEKGILKQFFYSVEAKDIPQSRYHKLQSESRLKNLLYALLLMILLGVMVYFVSPEKSKTFIENINSLGKYAVVAYLVIIFFVLLTLFIIVGWFKKNGKVQEVNILDKAKLKNEKINDESVFDKNMDEIVYFFECTKKKIVFIEDMDRFDSTNIFVALRQLNGILNNNEKLKNSIKFVYAIRDDMFEEEERTKFFDFIIPIVPYISSTNSIEVLRRKLKIENGMNKSSLYNISGNFISLIAPYIRDMRTLNCICNEFIVFKNTLKGNSIAASNKTNELDLDEEKMFAIVVFKNLYPKDFAELEAESEKSIVKCAFFDKNNFIRDKEGLIEKKKNNEVEKIKNIENECCNNIKELKILLLNSLTEFKSAVYMIDVNNNKYSLEDLLKDSFDVNLIKAQSVRIYWHNKNQSSNSWIEDIEDIVKEKGDYFSRIDSLNKGLNECREESRRAIEKYEKNIDGLYEYSIRQIIEEFGVSFLSEPVQSNDFLVLLLRHGYLDEEYENYINYFYPNRITKEEMNFILGIRNHRSNTEYSYPLKNVEQICGQLQEFEFKQKEILNYDLIDYILEKNEDDSSLAMLTEQLSNHSMESMSFIKAYVERGRHVDTLIRLLCKKNHLFWSDITGDDGIPIETRYKYLVLMLQNADMEDILMQNNMENGNKGLIVEFLTSYSDSLKNISAAPVEKQKKLIDELGIVFNDVETDSLDEIIRKEIFDNCRYKLNEIMIRRLFEWKSPEQVDIQTKKNYSSILRLEYQPLSDYVQDYFVTYVSDIVIGMETNTEEDIDAVENILERLLPDEEELCFKVLDKEGVVWKNINDCCAGVENTEADSKKKVWNYLLSEERVSCTWNNFVIYYEECGSDEAWEKYFEKNIDVFLDDIENPVITGDVLRALLYADISVSNFKKLIRSGKIQSYDGELKDLGEEKIEIMIKENLMPFTVEYWAEMGNVAPKLREQYAKINREDFVRLLDELDITEQEINDLLLSGKFTQEDKGKLIGLLDVASLSVDSAMAIRNLDFKVARSYVDKAWDVLEEENKYQLLLNQIDNYENDELAELFKELADVYRPLSDRSRHKVKLECTDYNKMLLEKLKEHQYITSFQKEENEENLLYSVNVKQVR